MVIQLVLRLTVVQHLFSYFESPIRALDCPLLPLQPLAIVFHLLVLLAPVVRMLVCEIVQLVYDGGNRIEVVRGGADVM